MHIARFDHALDNKPKLQEVTWETFLAEIIGTDPVFTERSKKQIPLFSPVEYTPGTTRAKRNVVAVEALALDFDKLSEAQCAHVFGMLEREGIESVVYTSYSHTERLKAGQGHSFRVVCKLSRPVPATEWSTFWKAFVTKYALPADPSCCDESRMYSLPYTANKQLAWIEPNPGEPIDVDIVMAELIVKAEKPKSTPNVSNITTRELKSVASKLVKQSSAKAKTEGALLGCVARGEAYQTPTGGRHEAMLAITTALAREFPHATIDALADLLDPSHEAMAAEDPSFQPEQRHVDTVRALEGARNHRDNYIAEKRAQELAELTDRIRTARGDGKDIPYTEEELAAICKMQGCTIDELPKRWIMRKGDTCYVLTLQGYRKPVTKSAIVNEARDYLAPAGISVTKVTREGMRYKTATELLDECATNFEESNTVLGTDYGHTVQNGPYITMNEAACGLADIQAEYSPRAEAYAKSLGGKHIDKFLDWLATYMDLSRATCALYLMGQKGVGKTAFSQMLAAMWRSGEVVKLGTARGDFNEALARTPIVIVDEFWPEKLKAADSGVFRDIVSATKHELSRKYLASSTIIGAVRLIMMANDDRLIKFSDMTNLASQEAVAERLLILEIPEQSENMFLQDPTLYQHLVTERGFAKYCLYLQATRKVESGRFLVAGEMSSAIESMSLAIDTNEQACQWIASVVENPKALGSKYSDLVRAEGGGILVNTTAYASTFETYITSKAYKAPTVAAAGRALAQLSVGSRVKRQIGGKAVWYHVINTELVASWIERSTFGSREDFLAGVAKLQHT